jgi:hypothetical protein
MQTQYAEAITSEVSSKSYSIEFESGSANIKPASYKMLNEIFESAVVAEGLKLGVYGHTDNSGSDAAQIPAPPEAIPNPKISKFSGANTLASCNGGGLASVLVSVLAALELGGGR